MDELDLSGRRKKESTQSREIEVIRSSAYPLLPFFLESSSLIFFNELSQFHSMSGVRKKRDEKKNSDKDDYEAQTSRRSVGFPRSSRY